MNRKALEDGFAYLDQHVPSIQQSMIYASEYNFLGRSLPCYKPYAVLTLSCIHALEKAQEQAKQFGYDLVIYDAYRPLRAYQECQELFEYSHLATLYYPRLDANQIWDYFPLSSDYSTGNAVSVSLISKNKKLHKPTWHYKIFNSITLPYYDDGAVDMYTGVNLFDYASFTESKNIPSIFREKRLFLAQLMENAGFSANKIWSSFTLKINNQKHDFLY